MSQNTSLRARHYYESKKDRELLLIESYEVDSVIFRKYLKKLKSMTNCLGLNLQLLNLTKDSFLLLKRNLVRKLRRLQIDLYYL